MLKRLLTTSAAVLVVAACGETPVAPTSLDRGTVMAAAPGQGNDNSQGAQFFENGAAGFILFTSDGVCTGSYADFPKVSDFTRLNPDGSQFQRKQYEADPLSISTADGNFSGSGTVKFSRTIVPGEGTVAAHWTVTGRVTDAQGDLHTVVCKFDRANGTDRSWIKIN